MTWPPVPNRLEVRCCCDPSRLYGHMTVPRDVVIGEKLRYRLAPEFREGRIVPGGEVVLEVARVTVPFEPSWPSTYLALKYHGDDLTFAQKVVQISRVDYFTPANPEDRMVL